MKRFLLFLLVAGSVASEPGFIRRPVSPVSEPGPLLRLMDNRALGIAWTNSLPPPEYARRQNLMNGSGLALGDFDGDGLCDVFLCNKFGASALLKNLGNWKFTNVAERAGVTCANMIPFGAVFADINGDGRLDLLVTSFLGPNACFQNLGDGLFTNVTAQVGISPVGGSTSMALGDLDGDGDLDLYMNYFGIEALLRDGASFSTRMVGGRPVVTGRYSKRLRIIEGRVMEFGEPDALYINQGGLFAASKWDRFKLAEPPNDFGLAVQIRDINGDGSPDIYVCNDFQTPDRLWLNDGRGHFSEPSALALRNMSYASMGVDFADIDRDGFLDFIAVEMLSRDHRRLLRQSSPKSPTRRTIGEIDIQEEVARNALYHNRGDGTYEEISWFSGVAASDWSWTPIFVDVDLDGYEDLLISNGHLHDVNDRDSQTGGRQLSNEEKRRAFSATPRLDTPNAAFRNRADLTFEDVTVQWGFHSPEITHGMALADLDNDGDLDVVANCVNADPLFYKNNSAQPRIAVRLRGNAPNAQGIGAVIELRQGKLKQTQEIISGGRYLSGDDSVRTFACPVPEAAAKLTVTWRNGRQTILTNVQPNSIYEIVETNSIPHLTTAVAATPKQWFVDESDSLKHTHFETAFDDFERQPNLPRRYSQLGPGLGWVDIDGDGNDELVIGSGRGGFVTTARRGIDGAWKTAPLHAKPLRDDAGGLISWPAGTNNQAVIAIANYEVPGTNKVAFLNSGLEAGFASKVLSPGPICSADIDGDGDLDLFIGGRLVPGRFPENPESALWINENGRLVEQLASSNLLQNVGMVSAAVFSDLNADGFPELILAIEWGPIRILSNDRGQLRDATGSYGLDKLTGLWNSVTTGDLDGDGRLEIICGNIGLNTAYARGGIGPWMLYYGNFSASGRAGLTEAYRDPVLNALVPMRDRDTISGDFPAILQRFPTHAAFAQASMADILGREQSHAKFLTAQTLASTVLWNRGAQFVTESLPPPVQFAPAYGLNVADFDNDGFEDLFVAQNFFAARSDDDRLDAGRGLLLQGMAKGKLRVVPGQESGLLIYGEQRASAVSDYDQDGRVDLAVSQNGAATRLFRNRMGPAGIRVKLKGPPGNPHGVGAILRTRSGGRSGPAREVHSGSGYWSQDSFIQILPKCTEVSVLWPGGKTVTYPVSPAAASIELPCPGND